jgi:putative ABC transport system permease protein
MSLAQNLDTAAKDVRYAIRQLRLNPGFTTVAVLSLALGIGANTAIFQLVDAVRLRSLPVQHPQELAYVDFKDGSMRSGWFSTRSARFTYTLWEQIRSSQQAFSGFIAWSATQFNLTSGGEARYAQGMYVSGDFFQVLGVPSIIGRTFVAADDTAACNSPGAVISHAFWQREFAGQPNVLERTVMLNNKTFPVVGVTGPNFFGVEVGNQYDVALPLCVDKLLADDGRGRMPGKTAFWLSAMGRLKPGWTLERANAHLQTISPAVTQAGLPPEYRPEDAKRFLANKLEATSAATGVSGLRRQYERPLWLLLATTALVLLIACANLANLLLARASIREREIAVRQAIGASRVRLVTQLLSESLLLAAIGAALGVGLAHGISTALVAFLSTPNNPVFIGLGIDLRVLGFTSALAILTCLLFGLVPALRATRLAPASVMRASGRGLSSGKERFSLRRALIVTQVALSMVLLVGAMLFSRSLQKLLGVDPGFRPEGILQVSFELPRGAFTKERLPVLYRDVHQRMSNVPGVVSAANVGLAPISGGGWNDQVRPEGKTTLAESFFNRVGPGYFRTMNTALIAGRDFDDRDTLNAPNVAIVNEEFVKRFFEGTNPVGRTFQTIGRAGQPDPVHQIVGVVKNTKYYNLREAFRPISFFPMGQERQYGSGMTFMLRTAGPLNNIYSAVKQTMGEVHPQIGIDFRLLTSQIDNTLQRDRLMATLSSAFGLLAALLATLGLYGVISYMVARRRNEIGIRMALGANRGKVIGLVLREAGVMLAAGLVAGTLLAVWAAQAASTLLFELKPHDPVTLAGAIGLLTAVAMLASFAPARRASRLDPMNALRDE